MRKVTIFFLTATAIGFFSLTSCTKNNTTTINHPDSVYTSAWVTLSMQLNNVDSDYEENISAPAITSAILDKGVILGYGAYLNASNDTVVENALEFDMFQTVSVGNILLQAGFDNSGLWYRYVIVPGSVLTTKGLTPLQAKSLSYAEATKLFGSAANKVGSPTIQ
ncbi:MAG TPA: hypothetical protein VMH27_12935 [Puia sp.]|nr:hypothetical protein [Puia sp.]